MKVGIIGSGGREHALAWKLSQDPAIKAVFAYPGSVGIAMEPKVVCTGINAGAFAKIADHCQKEGLDFVVVGPDQQLADGVVDFLASHGIPAFGPVKAAARIEASKAFSKELMKELSIPTARFEVFSEVSAAQDFLKSVEWGDGWVVKADGLALGKGVVVCESREEALRAVDDFLVRGEMGDAGRTVVVEERLIGREVSAFSLCDGDTSVFLGFACDYKTLQEGNQGPNTGGMGSFSPPEWIERGLEENVSKQVVLPLLRGMKDRGIPFKGVLFTGLIITNQGPKVLEFNARFGDPETQSILALMDEELLPWLMACESGTLSTKGNKIAVKTGKHVCHVVMAAQGYPGTGGAAVRKGDTIAFAPNLLNGNLPDQCKVFFAGVVGDEASGFKTAGGRVLGVTALANSAAQARKQAYEAVSKITFSGAQFRNDVGL